MPSPPSSLLLVTVFHEILAVPFPSICPFRRNFPHKEFISYVHPFGRIKVLDQKLMIPLMTVLISWSRPAKERALEDQAFILDLTD